MMRQGARGTTLPEMLIYLAIVTILLSLTGWLVVTSTRTAEATRTSLTEAAARVTVLERVGADVRCAKRVLDAFGESISDANTLILDGSVDGPVVCRFRDGTLTRECVRKGERVTETIASPGRLTFRYEGDDARRSRWVEVRLSAEKGAGVVERFRLMDAGGRP